MTWVHLTKISGNRKVGPIKVTTTEKSSCPSECGIADECYAGGGPLNIHWNQVSQHNRGDNWDGFVNRVKRFRKNELWRHNQAGDLPQNENGKLDSDKCEALADAASHTDGWTYTHYDPTDDHNNSVISGMNEVGGLVVNLSADTVEQADEYQGLPIVVCPAQTQEDMSCNICELCQKRDRKSIVGFKAHGTKRKKLSEKLVSNAI